MSFLKVGDSINFQKASCTLDGCVKIYSSRVDSVAEQTGKLLTGLVSDGKSVVDSLQRGDDINNEDVDGDVIKKKRHTSKNNVETLEKNMENLTLKQVDQECSADPLFRKMCAQFDELSGMAGMLQSISPINVNDLSIVFDSIGEGECNSIEAQMDISLNAMEALGNLHFLTNE